MEQTYDSPDDLQVHNPLSVMQPGEKVVCEVKRHPIGMLSKYIVTGIGIVAFGLIAVLVVPQVVSQASQTQAREFALLAVAIVAIISGLILYVSSTIYYKNRWIVTSDSITQVQQNGLFSAQTSQLSMANLQDVTVIQDGLFPTMFNYGILRAETAGERSKFMFTYCPSPKNYARQILMARENFINGGPAIAKRGNDDLVVPRGPGNGVDASQPYQT